MSKVFVSTAPFAETHRYPTDLLDDNGISYQLNPTGRRLRENEVIELIGDSEVLIAGTEPITVAVMEAAPNLRLISRVGVGLDNVDLTEAKTRGIKVSYTPNAPAPAVADLSIGLILSLLRNIHSSNLQIRSGLWQRTVGRRLATVTVGIIGVGRIGRRVTESLSRLGTRKILVNDLVESQLAPVSVFTQSVSKEEIYRESDVISIHVPMTHETHNMIGLAQLNQMKSDALLVNTARGAVINEKDLRNVLMAGHLGGVALDVFADEPYHGDLISVERCLLTSHIGSMSRDCREDMESEATLEAIRFLVGDPLQNQVPEYEYERQQVALGPIA